MKMRFSEWADFVNGFTGERPKELRLGQWAFKLLHDSHPKIAEEIHGTGIDPFYCDDHIPALLSELLREYVVMDDPLNDPVAAPRNDELELRRMLAFSYAGASLYVDDGELQDNSRLPVIDFKRDSIEEIQEKMRIFTTSDNATGCRNEMVSIAHRTDRSPVVTSFPPPIEPTSAG